MTDNPTQRNQTMKRLIAAVSFAALAVPAVAAEYGMPFEQAELDRALPQINFPAVESRSADPRSLPYEQAQADRALPSFGSSEPHLVAASGNTRSDVEISVQAETVGSNGRHSFATGPWANDYNFIAPAQ